MRHVKTGVASEQAAGVGGGGGDALTTDPLSQFAATTSAQLRGVISDETGTGALVFATSPTLVTPALGTPASGTLTNCTGLPQAGTVGLTTADSPQFTAVNVGHATDTTITRVSAGKIAVEGNEVYQAGGTDVAIADGGTGASTAVGARTALRQHTDNDLTDAATVAVNAALGEHFNVTLAGNRTLGNPTNAPAAGLTQMLVIRVKQDATGSRTLAYDTKYRFSTDIPSPTLTTTASKQDVLTFKYDADADKWDLVAIVKGF